MDESESDSEACGIVGREEYDEGIYNLKAKEWADSMIVTPHTQPVVSNRKSKRAGSIHQSPKSAFKIRSLHHSSQNPTPEPYNPIPPELSQPVPSASNEPCEAQPSTSHGFAHSQPPVSQEPSQAEPSTSHRAAHTQPHVSHESVEPESQTSKFTIDLPQYLSLDVGLDGLEAYDQRNLSQPIGTSKYDYDVELEGGSPEKADESAEDGSEDADFVVDNE